MNSSDALDLFRNTPAPFKASFRRFEDDDDFDSDNENSQDAESEHTSFMREDASNMMHALSVNPMHSKTNSVNFQEWSTGDVCEWLLSYGKSLNKEEAYEKYCKMFEEQNITGERLKKFEKKDLLNMGIEESDYLDVYSGIQQLKNIIFKAPSSQQNQQKKESSVEDDIVDDIENDNNDKENDADYKEEKQTYEQPFLPYMYNAPSVKLTDKTRVNVYSARVVAPFNKKAFALYEMEVVEGENEWLLSKRYTEFHRLYTAMKKIGVHLKGKFPKKGLFYSSTDKQVIEERKNKLTIWINLLLESYPKARESKELNDFLSPLRTFVVDE